MEGLVSDEKTTSLDDVVAAVMQMGFEHQDCQEAISNGKLTVQSVVDWILSGKPNNQLDSQPRLSLNQTRHGTSSPFLQQQNPSVSNMDTTNATPQLYGLDISTTQDAVVSRAHLTDKQRMLKESFEEKEKEEAKRQAADEKRRKRQDKERVLKEIQADREKHQLKYAKKEAATIASTASSGACAVAASSIAENTANSALIQVRLPNDTMLRLTLPPSSTLSTVWEKVHDEIKSEIVIYEGFIQPFPRKEFTRADLKNSLAELGLTPSGSLVLKKKEATQAAPVPSEAAQANIRIKRRGPGQNASPGETFEADPVPSNDDQNDIRVGMDQEEMDPNQQLDPANFPGFGNPLGQHSLPRENNVPAQLPVNAGRYQDVDMRNVHDAGPHQNINMGDMEEEYEAQIEDQDGAQAMDEGINNPVFHRRAFAGVGNRLIPEGVPGDNNRHLWTPRANLAADAAAQRMAANRQVEPPPIISAPDVQLHCPNSLQAIVMQAVIHRITDKRNPVFSLASLSTDALTRILDHLKKEHLLDSRILRLMPSYLSRLDLSYYPFATNELLNGARSLVHLQSLNLSSCSLITDDCLEVLAGMKDLKFLNLNGCFNITNTFFTIVSALPSVQSLCLEETKVTDQGLQQLSQQNKLPPIVHIALGRTAVTHEAFQYLACFTSLKSLSLKKTKIESMSGIEKIVSLQDLDVSDTHIHTDSVLVLSRLPKLQHLNLANTESVNGDQALSYLRNLRLSFLHLPVRLTTTNAGLAYIVDFPLTSLNLTNYSFVNDEGMRYVGQISTLEKLVLTNTKITDTGLNYLKELTRLQELFLDKTGITNPTVIANFVLLRELSLSKTNITSDFLKQGILNSCPVLTKLNLNQTIVNDKGIAELRLLNLTWLDLKFTRVHPSAEETIKKHCPNLQSIIFSNLNRVEEMDEM